MKKDTNPKISQGRCIHKYFPRNKLTRLKSKPCFVGFHFNCRGCVRSYKGIPQKNGLYLTVPTAKNTPGLMWSYRTSLRHSRLLTCLGQLWRSLKEWILLISFFSFVFWLYFCKFEKMMYISIHIYTYIDLYIYTFTPGKKTCGLR